MWDILKLFDVFISVFSKKQMIIDTINDINQCNVIEFINNKPEKLIVHKSPIQYLDKNP